MKLKLTVAIMLVALIVIAGFVRDKVSVSTDPQIEIGFIAPLTGPFADWGESIKNGAMLANESLGSRFQIDYQDDACDPKQALSIAKNFFELESIRYVIGPGCEGSLLAIMSEAIENQAIIFSTGLLSDQVFENYDTNLINLATQISTESGFIAKAISKAGHKKVFVIHGDNEFGIEYGRSLRVALKKLAVDVVADETSPLGTNDFRSTIVTINSSKADAIFIHQGEREVGTFIKQLRESGNKSQVYSYYAIENQSFLNASDGAAEGLIYSSPYNSQANTQQYNNFTRQYQARFNTLPTPTSYFVYDGLVTLNKAIDNCGSQNAQCVENFIKNQGQQLGLSGEYEIKVNGMNTRPFKLKNIKNGKFVEIN